MAGPPWPRQVQSIANMDPASLKVSIIPQNKHAGRMHHKDRESCYLLCLPIHVCLMDAELVHPQCRRLSPLKNLLSENENNEKDGHGKVDKAGQCEVAPTEAGNATPPNQCSCHNKPGTTSTADCHVQIEEPRLIQCVLARCTAHADVR